MIKNTTKPNKKLRPEVKGWYLVSTYITPVECWCGVTPEILLKVGIKGSAEIHDPGHTLKFKTLPPDAIFVIHDGKGVFKYHNDVNTRVFEMECIWGTADRKLIPPSFIEAWKEIRKRYKKNKPKCGWLVK